MLLVCRPYRIVDMSLLDEGGIFSSMISVLVRTHKIPAAGSGHLKCTRRDRGVKFHPAQWWHREKFPDQTDDVGRPGSRTAQATRGCARPTSRPKSINDDEDDGDDYQKLLMARDKTPTDTGGANRAEGEWAVGGEQTRGRR